MKRALGILILALPLAAQTVIYMPSNVGQVQQVISATGTSPTVLTTRESHGFAPGDVVMVYGIVESTGTVNQYSALNAPAGSARKIGTTPSGTTFTLTDLSGAAVNTSNTVLVNSGIVRKAVASTLNAGPRAGLGGTGSVSLTQLSATIQDSTLTNIAVSGGVATINYAYPHGLTGSGNRVQVRNASATDLNGIKTVTVTGAQTLTYSTTAPDGTYTDANLGVSARALDGDPVWEKLKYSASTWGTSRLDFIYQASTDSGTYFNWAAEAMLWYVDRSQATALSNAVYSYQHFEDFYPSPQMCGESSGQYCNFGAPLNTPRLAASDYLRLSVPAFALGYSLIRSQLSTGTRTAIANYFLNDVADSCTHTTPVQGPGTITLSGTTVTGSGTTFTASFHVGDYVFEFSGNYDHFARVISIASDTSMTVTGGSQFSGSASNYYVSPAFSTGQCGVRNFYAHHVAGDATRDARLYQLPYTTGDVPAGWTGAQGAWGTTQGNNQGVTASAANVAIGSALAEDDSRAVKLLQDSAEFSFDFHAAERLGTWGGLSISGPNYVQNRTDWLSLLDSLVAQNSIAGYPDTITGMVGAAQYAYQFLYSWLPATDTTDPRFVPYSDSWPWDVTTETHKGVSFATLLGASYGNAASGQLNYWLSNFNASWTNPGANSYFMWAPIGMLFYNPNLGAATDFRSLPLQVDLADSDSSRCAALGLRCADTSNAWYANAKAKRASVISRSSWSAPATVILESNLGQIWSTYGIPNDHGAAIPGNYHLVRSVTGDTGDTAWRGCLVGDNDGRCVFSENAGYSHDSLYKNNTALDAGALPSLSGNVLAYGPVLLRWSGANKFGDSASRYSSSTWDLKGFYDTGVTLATRSSIHFKKPGADEYYLVYDDVARTTGYAIAGFTQYPQGAPAGVGTAGTTIFSGGLLTSTNADSQRVLSRWLAPAGAATLAVLNDGTTGYGGNNYAYRLRHCASLDGSTCNASATAMESIQAHYITTSANSALTSTLISPDANWACAQVTGATSTAVGCFSRGGLRANPAAFTTSYSGTAQVLLTGLVAGTYPVTVNGTPVSGSPFTVSAGDNSLYFESTAGTVSFAGATPAASGTSQGKVSFQGKIWH